MLMTGGEGECGCGHDSASGREEVEEEKEDKAAYIQPVHIYPTSPKAVAAAGLAAATATAAIAAAPRPPKRNK